MIDYLHKIILRDNVQQDIDVCHAQVTVYKNHLLAYLRIRNCHVDSYICLSYATLAACNCNDACLVFRCCIFLCLTAGSSASSHQRAQFVCLFIHLFTPRILRHLISCLSKFFFYMLMVNAKVNKV